MPDAIVLPVPIYKGFLIEWIGRVLRAIGEDYLSIEGSSPGKPHCANDAWTMRPTGRFARRERLLLPGTQGITKGAFASCRT
jgi:hypothetical protein